MNILWLTWKDIKHPEAGGAEVLNDELAKRLVKDGHKLKMIVGGFKDAKSEVKINGYEVIRLGGKFSVYLKTFIYIKKHKLNKWSDHTIEEINTIPFFSKFYIKKPRTLIIYQLARKVWYYQMILPFSIIGYYAEYFYVWLLRNENVITISNSSKNDLISQGFKAKNISIISIGTYLKPMSKIPNQKKQPIILSLGTVRPMKQTLDQIKAFELAKNENPSLKFILAGSTNSKYGQQVKNYIKNSQYKQDIEVLDFVPLDKKISLMKQAHVILVTSIKEGWGLIVTEAASQGTPAIVYNRDGLRDSTFNGEAGWITNPNPEALSKAINNSFDEKLYKQKQKIGWEKSKQLNFDKSYSEFSTIIES